MTPQELKELIAKGESSTLEFKRKVTTPEKLAKEISAIANTKGGCLLVGVDDDGTIYGIDSEKYEIEQILQACEIFIDPPITPEIEMIAVKRKEVIIVYIPEGRQKPHSLLIDEQNGRKPVRRAFIRVGEKSVMASSEMYRFLSELSADKPLKISIGDKERRLFTYLESHERATVNDFANIVNISKKRAERLLVRLVRAGTLHIHNDDSTDYFTLV
ncbi:MAG: hypothetical protein QG635_1245 [Bacteroidota bacterium]|nr:hypothetical protein [Bacteroidota bacterium]